MRGDSTRGPQTARARRSRRAVGRTGTARTRRRAARCRTPQTSRGTGPPRPARRPTPAAPRAGARATDGTSGAAAAHGPGATARAPRSPRRTRRSPALRSSPPSPPHPCPGPPLPHARTARRRSCPRSTARLSEAGAKARSHTSLCSALACATKSSHSPGPRCGRICRARREVGAATSALHRCWARRRARRSSAVRAPPRRRGGEAAEGEEGGEKAGEESGEEGGEGEEEEAGEALAHRGRLLELEFDGAPSGRLEGPLGVVAEVVVPHAARSEGGRGWRAWSSKRTTHPLDMSTCPRSMRRTGVGCIGESRASAWKGTDGGRT